MKNILNRNQFIALLIIGFAIAATTFSSCKKDDGPGPDEGQELITSLLLHFENAGTTSTFAWRDLDGIGGIAATIDTIVLAPNTTYALTLEVLDESKTPVENITEEIEEEDEDHLFLFQDDNNVLSITTIDTDANGDPVGLENTVVTSAGTGNLTISLKHQSDKANPNNTGETDIEVTMPYKVE
ncbi:MAG: hypothetical protein KDC24_14625 [Saprospiraceae bacterium]|nr:hypothetical protein [Saprospiraceae bacterium]